MFGLLIGAQAARAQHSDVISPVIFTFDERGYAPGALRFGVESSCVAGQPILWMDPANFNGINHLFSVARNQTIHVSHGNFLPLLEAHLASFKPVAHVRTLLQQYVPYDHSGISQQMLSLLSRYMQRHSASCVFDFVGLHEACVAEDAHFIKSSIEILCAMDNPESGWYRYSLMRSWSAYSMDLTREVRFLIAHAVVESLRTGSRKVGLDIIADQLDLTPIERLQMSKSLGDLIQAKGRVAGLSFREKIDYVGMGLGKGQPKRLEKIPTVDNGKQNASYISFFLWSAIAALSIFVVSKVFGFRNCLFKPRHKERRPPFVPRAAVMQDPLPTELQCGEMHRLILIKFPGKTCEVKLDHSRLKINSEDKLFVDVLHRAIAARKMDGLSVSQKRRNLFLRFDNEVACRNFHSLFEGIVSETEFGVEVNFAAERLLREDVSAASDARPAAYDARVQALQQVEDEERAAERAAERARKEARKVEAAEERAEAARERQVRSENLRQIYAARSGT